MLPKLYVFDLDLTLWDYIDLYPNVEKILKELRKRKHLVYLASFNPSAVEILKRLNINHYFHGGVFGGNNKYSKYQMIEQIRQKINFNGKVEFYDDHQPNIIIVKAHDPSIRSVLVEDGIKWSDVFYESGD